MHAAYGERLPEQIRAALITTYPMFAWRAEFFADKGDRAPVERAGIAVRARRGPMEHEVRVPATAIQQTCLTDVVQQIYSAAATALHERARQGHV
jgi:hypothetical protein